MSVDTPDRELVGGRPHARLAAIPAFNDNYLWTLCDTTRRSCVVVDPGDADVVVRWCAENNLVIAAILITHHHADHVGGLQALKQDGVTVYGPRNENIAGIDVRLGEGDTFRVPGFDTEFTVLDVPGHTAGHIAFLTQLDDGPLLFCGDTLFSAGCGRLFEGTAEQMFASLSHLAKLPGNTRVCCAHEYTLSNLRFAAAVEPDNADIVVFTEWATAARQRGEPTLPGLMAREMRINPFLRSAEHNVRAAAAAHAGSDAAADPAAVFAILRRWKDVFR